MPPRRGGGRGRGGGPAPEVSKEEYAVAKFLRSNVPTKTTTLCGMKVDYFVGSKAIDALLASHWGEKSKKKESKLFESREDAVAYCQRLLDKKQLFHRARKIVQNKKDEEEEAPTDESKSKRRIKKKEDSSELELSKKKKKHLKAEPAEEPLTEEEGSSKKKRRKEKGEESVAEDAGGEGTPVVKEKKKKRIKLDMHEDQTFIDGNEAYVWIYDPIRPTTFLIGLALVVGAIAVCLFPLWPEWMRVGAYYLSLVAAGLLGFILALSIFRYILYAFLWLATLGKVQFFLLPNLTEDVGFFDSFLPAYELETHWGNDSDDSDKKKKKKRKKAKDSDNEDADSDSGDRKSAETAPEMALDDAEDDLPEQDEDTQNEMYQEDETNDDPDADIDADPPSGAGSSNGSDADYEIISHGDLNNGDAKVTASS